MNSSQTYRIIPVGLGIALLIALCCSPLASSKPDGLNRVAKDLNFDRQENLDAPAGKLPFAAVFEGYALKGVPNAIATPLAGAIGTMATFGLAWGIGKLVVRQSAVRVSDRDSDRDHA
jgi:cobalt/nickel transport protein